MDRRPKIQDRLPYTVLLPLIAAGLALCSSRLAWATPHTVARRASPYDANWPDVYLLVMSKCAGCHRAGGETFDLTSHQAILAAKNEDGKKTITPGNSGKSSFYTQVLWNARGEKHSRLPAEPEMPTDPHDWLTPCQLDIVRQWIDDGARQFLTDEPCEILPLTEMDFPSAKVCKACHAKQYEQWSGSMHAYAQHSPVFEAFNQTLQERTSGTIGTFCSRCHTPIGTALGENGLLRNVHRSRISMEGVTCVVCHRQAGPTYKSNARIALNAGTLNEGCMFGPFESDASVDLKSHKSIQTPHIKSAAFCGTCHDVTSPEGVRLEEAFSEWQNSPAAREEITCQHCHMGQVQGIPIRDHERPLGYAAIVPGVDRKKLPLRRMTDHSFAGPDYSMLPDTEFPYKLDWMYEIDYRDRSALTPYQQKTLDQLRRRNRRALRAANAKRHELLQQAAEIRVQVCDRARPGEKITVRVDVTNKVSGHSVPTGFTAERQMWVEIVARDSKGNVIFSSGDLDGNGDLRDGHSYAVETRKISRDKYLLNFQNKFVVQTARGTDRSVVLPVNRHLRPLSIVRPATGISASHGRPYTFRIAKGSLPPLKTLGRSYPIHLPDCDGTCTISVRLNFRHLPPVLFDVIGTPHLKRQLEIVTIAEDHRVIHVANQ